MRKGFNPAQKQDVIRKACRKCQNTGWCHAKQRCDVTGRALRIMRPQPEKIDDDWTGLRALDR